jgi:signal peptide peptidase SppA
MIEILSVKAWALESRFFNRLAPAVLGWMSGGRDISALISKADTPKIEAGKTYQVNQDLFFSNEDGYFFQDEEDQIIPRTSLKGVVTKEGGLCSIGTRQLGQMMQLNDQKKNVSAHLIEIDSPGGAVDGTPELGNIIAGLDKPVIAYVDNMAASAAYWIASQADHIITNSQNYTEVGSIGTLAVLANEKEYLKKQGMKVEIIRATKSVDKARLNSIEDWPEESMAELQQDLDRINGDFINTVNTGRNGKLFTMGEDIFTGRMYDQRRALALGMVDQVGTFEEALITARNLAKTYKNKTKK